MKDRWMEHLAELAADRNPRTCATCKHWPEADREIIAKLYASGFDPKHGPYWGGYCTEIREHVETDGPGVGHVIKTDDDFGCIHYAKAEEPT